MSQASSVLITSKVAVRRESLSHRSFGSALVAENGVQLDASVSGDKHNIPNILLW